MALFGRRKQADVVVDDDIDTGEVLDQDAGPDESADVVDVDDAARKRRAQLRPREEVDLSNGPYDRADMPGEEVLDFGAIAVGAVDGVELRLDVDENTQVITGMTAVLSPDGSAAVQLQAFAAPKTSGVWYGIRREIADAIIAAGGSADEVDGPLGTELHVRMPQQGPDGRTTFAPVRFLGVDGPRWFLRAVLSGEAAVDDAVAARALQVVRSVGVRRGNEPRAPRELLELTIPAELMAREDAEPITEQSGIERLERGPEIAETR